MINNLTISELLLKIYSASPEQDFFEHILKVFESHIPSTISTYSITDLETGTFENQEQHSRKGGVRPEGSYVSSFADQHPFFEHYINNNVGPVIAITDFLSEEEWKDTAIYKGLHQKYGVVHDTSVRFYDGSQCISFCFSDPLPMTPENRRLLTLLAPHLDNAYRMYRLQKERGLGRASGKIILLSESGKLKESLLEAQTLLDTYCPRRKKRPVWTLPEDVVLWVRSRIKAMNAAGHSAPGLDKFVVRRGKSMLLLGLHRHGSGYILLLEEIPSLRTMDILMEFGLTPREAEVAIWIIQGKKNSDIATILDVSTATVSKHIEHILRKLKCESRSAVVQLVMQTIIERMTGALPGRCATCAKLVCESC